MGAVPGVVGRRARRQRGGVPLSRSWLLRDLGLAQHLALVRRASWAIPRLTLGVCSALLVEGELYFRGNAFSQISKKVAQFVHAGWPADHPALAVLGHSGALRTLLCTRFIPESPVSLVNCLGGGGT